MIPEAIIQQAQAEGVRLALSPSGAIKATGTGEAISRWSAIIREHKQGIIRALKAGELTVDQQQSLLTKLAPFRFDLVREEIEEGYPADFLHRVNNMAWNFMQTDGMAFQEALDLAASIVVKSQAKACEAAYEDAMALFDRVKAAA